MGGVASHCLPNGAQTAAAEMSTKLLDGLRAGGQTHRYMTLVKPLSRQARHYRKLRRLHICTRCRGRARRGRVHCRQCAEAANRASKLRYARLMASVRRLEALVEAQSAA
jgi:hypothetical protein